MINKIYNWMHPEEKVVAGKRQLIDAGRIDSNLWIKNIIFDPPMQKLDAQTWTVIAADDLSFVKDGEIIRHNSYRFEKDVLGINDTGKVGTILCVYFGGKFQAECYSEILSDRESWEEAKKLIL